MTSNVRAVDHVQLPMPYGASPAARRFYGGLLELEELSEPARVGTLHYAIGWQRLDLTEGHYTGIAPQAHLALQVLDLEHLAARLRGAGFALDDAPLLDERRFFVEDPFHNRLELIAPQPAVPRDAALSRYRLAI